MRATKSWDDWSVVIPSVISDGNQPGHSELTRTLRRASCRPSSRLRLTTAPLLAQYDACLIGADPTWPSIEATLTMLPAAVGHERVHGQLAQVPRGGHIDLEHELEVLQRLLLQRRRPTDAGVVDQHVEASGIGQRGLDQPLPVGRQGQVDRDHDGSVSPAARASSRSARRAAMTTRAPTASSTWAKRAPSPDEAPVTMATLPSRRNSREGIERVRHVRIVGAPAPGRGSGEIAADPGPTCR